MYIGMDNYKAGRMCGELVKEALPDGGNVMLFIGRLEQDNSKYRRQGVIDELLDRDRDAQYYKDQQGAWVPMLFPNIGISATENSWSTFHVIPVSAKKTIVETRTRVMPVSGWEFTRQGWSSWMNARWGQGDKYGTGDPSDPLASGDFMAEDVYACEQQFKAMHSPKFSVGATAKTMEKSILDYQSHLLAHTEAASR